MASYPSIAKILNEEGSHVRMVPMGSAMAIPMG